MDLTATSVAPDSDDALTSRIRCHKGNKPSLPQTKCCSLCPAKFTRTTHLNRHLRTHSNERLHRCETCLSEFTRSDLLTRHKRTCGDLNQNKSRRKSCQACAESKVRCDLVQPCAKCVSRGKECVFVNDPKISRDKREVAAAKRKRAALARSIDASTSATHGSSSSRFPDDHHFIEDPPCSPCDEDTEYSMISSSDLMACADSSTSSTSISSMSPCSDDFDHSLDITHAELDSPIDISIFKAELETFITCNALDSLLSQPYESPSPTDDLGSMLFNDFMWNGYLPDTPGMNSSLFAQAVIAAPSQSSLYLNQDSSAGPSTASPSMTGESLFHQMPDYQRAVHGPRPEDMEIQHYLYLFFTAFSSHLSIVHPSFWLSPEGKPPILLRAMQACGALFVKTREAGDFVLNTVASVREALKVEAQAQSSAGIEEHFYLVLAGLLIQTIGMFHRRIDRSASSGVYHGMLIQMIRRCGIVQRCTSWIPPDLANSSLEVAWQDWKIQEMIKRTVLLAYLHDNCHCVFFSLPPSFLPTELVDLHLPADDALWKTNTAQEWYDVISQPSAYGAVPNRLKGYSLQAALIKLSEPHTTGPSLPIPPCAHFILIHSILCSIYNRMDRLFTQSHQLMTLEGNVIISNSINPNPKDPVRTQCMLRNWLHSWLHAPEVPQQHLKAKGEPLLVQNALPYYWLAQVSLIAIQDRIMLPCCVPETRYRVLTGWLHHIRSFLRCGGEKMGRGLWEDLARMGQTLAASDNEDGPDGLLSIAPES